MSNTKFTPDYVMSGIYIKNGYYRFETICDKETTIYEAEILQKKQYAASDMYEALDGTIPYLMELTGMSELPESFKYAVTKRIEKIEAALLKAEGK